MRKKLTVAQATAPDTLCNMRCYVIEQRKAQCILHDFIKKHYRPQPIMPFEVYLIIPTRLIRG